MNITPLKTTSAAVLSAVAMAVFLSSPAKGQTLINYNFNSLSTGSLNSQDGWTSANAAQVATTPVDGPGGTLGVTNGNGSGGSTFATKAFFATSSLTSSDIVTLTFEAYQVSGANPSVSLFGIGHSSSQAQFGVWNGTLMIREEYDGVSGAPIHQALDSSGNNILINNNDWYSIQSVWDLSTRTATLYYKNLSAGDTSYTQVYFNAAQTQSSVSIGTYTAVNTWTTGGMRVGIAPGMGSIGLGTGYLDNLSAVIVPEPHTAALGALGLGMLMFRARRRNCPAA